MDIPVFTLGESISDEQRSFFDTHGFIRFGQVASHEEVDRLVEALEALEARFRAEERSKVLGTPLKWGQAKDGEPFIQRFAFASHFSKTISEFANDPRFEPVRLFIGEDARLGEVEGDGVVVNHWINSEGSRYRQLGWHTDGLRDLAWLRLPGPMLNVGLYLDDSPLEKGGVRLLPGTHTQGLFKMMFRKFYFFDNRADPEEVALVAEKGDLTIHDGRLWHRTAMATVTGEASRRRNMYMPYVQGAFHPRTESSKTPIYHRLQGFVG
ncbi:MAG: phytanoyl-CoA dioxygenase family protein [Myxococcota bacterium]|nr:phytanoyl-CoA dioxygenase family protein [Myxococcota bacterium]